MTSRRGECTCGAVARARHTPRVPGANWFVGLPVPGAEVLARVSAAPPRIRLFSRDDLHLTIAFLGACGEARARRAWDALEWRLPATLATLGAVIPMGSPRRYSALSALLETGRAEIESAMGASRAAVCAAAGAAADERPPKAHVTIARPQRSATDAERRDAVRWAASLRLEGVRVRLDSVALYTWSDDRAARLFRAVERRELAG